MPTILDPGRLRQKDCNFKASLGYIGRPCLKQTNKQQQKKPGSFYLKKKKKKYSLYTGGRAS
jgi:hypothetical protein